MHELTSCKDGRQSSGCFIITPMCYIYTDYTTLTEIISTMNKRWANTRLYLIYKSRYLQQLHIQANIGHSI